MTRSPSNTFALKNEKNLNNQEIDLPNKLDPEQLLRFSTLLQTTLDLPTLLDIFFREATPFIAFDGLTYSGIEENAYWELGKQYKHHCQYQLNLKKEALGEITFYRAQRFKEQELQLIETLLTSLIYPLRNAMSYHKAVSSSYMDLLTGLWNEKSLTHSLTREIAWVKHHQDPMTLLMLEIHQLNDLKKQYGLGAFHKALRLVSEICQMMGKTTDLCFRVGENQFAVLLRKINFDASQTLAEELKDAISRRTIHHNQHSFTISINVGLVHLEESHSEDAAHTLQHECDTLLQKGEEALKYASEYHDPGLKGITVNFSHEAVTLP